MDKNRSPKLYFTNLVLYITMGLLFIQAAIFYFVSTYFILTKSTIPLFSLGQIANVLGLLGMIFGAACIVVSLIGIHRDNKTGNDIGDKTKRGTAGRD